MFLLGFREDKEQIAVQTLGIHHQGPTHLPRKRSYRLDILLGHGIDARPIFLILFITIFTVLGARRPSKTAFPAALWAIRPS